MVKKHPTNSEAQPHCRPRNLIITQDSFRCILPLLVFGNYPAGWAGKTMSGKELARLKDLAPTQIHFQNTDTREMKRQNGS